MRISDWSSDVCSSDLRFKPLSQKGKFVGAITSYYDTKGIDIFLEAWAEIKSQFPNYAVRFYGAGDDLPKFRKLASELGLDVDFRDATDRKSTRLNSSQ